MPKILIVEDDPQIQQAVQAALERDGHEPVPAANGVVGLARACMSPPDLIVSDIVMPVMDGWSFLSRVREHRRLAAIPFIIMSSRNVAADLQRGFRLGADDYVPKPFEPSELSRRIDNLLYHGGRAAAARVPLEEPSACGVGLSGTLEEIGLTTLLTFLAGERRTGVVLVRDGRTRGRLFMRGGQVVSARIDHGPDLRDKEAILWLLRWVRGHFEFRSMPIEMADEVLAPTAFLVLEAARRRDEERHRVPCPEIPLLAAAKPLRARTGTR